MIEKKHWKELNEKNFAFFFPFNIFYYVLVSVLYKFRL